MNPLAGCPPVPSLLAQILEVGNLSILPRFVCGYCSWRFCILIFVLKGAKQGVGRTSGANVRHSFNGTEISLNLTPPPAAPFAAPQPESAVPRASGHSRSGSVGNWVSLSRHLAAPSPLHGPQSASPANEGKLNTPWLSPDQGTRYTEKASAWA
jgi:hypothetical protein